MDSLDSQMDMAPPKSYLITHISLNAWATENLGGVPNVMHYEKVNCMRLRRFTTHMQSQV